VSDHEIALLAPCDDCIKASVCAIKAVLDVEKATLRIPSIQWVTPRHDSMLVDCSEYIDVLDVKPPEKRRTTKRPPSQVDRLVGLVEPRRTPALAGHGRKANPTDDELVAHYATHTGAETAAHFGIARATVVRRLNEIEAAGGVITRKRPGRKPRVAVVDVDPNWSPDCMDATEWAEWQRLNPRLPLNQGGIAPRPCVDCPTTYAAEMRGLGRCNGEPGEVAA
jgi:hypothetical protein